MPTHSHHRVTRFSLLGTMIACLLAVASPVFADEDALEQHREQIGESLEKPVFRDEIRTDKNADLTSELHRLFVSAAVTEYRAEHERGTAPTPSEIAAAQTYFDDKHGERMKKQGPALRKKLKTIDIKLGETGLTKDEERKLRIEKRTIESMLRPPSEFFAVWTMKHWKFQQHLYKKFGGGRLLWQQAGVEAFDATRTWLESLESAGKFKISDPKLRSTLYQYWTRDHGHWLFDDKERIRNFVEPKFLHASTIKDSAGSDQTD